MAVSDRLSFENCSQLVNLIRYQLGDPHEYVSRCHFPSGSYFAIAEGTRDYCPGQEVPYSHTINFSWVIGQHFPKELEIPEITSPIITIGGCPLKWCLTMNTVWGVGNSPDEHDVYLKCINIGDVYIRAYVKMNLYKAIDKIGDDAVTSVSFDNIVSRHVVYTGVNWKSRTEKTDAVIRDLSRTYTIQGLMNLNNCCTVRRRSFPPLEPLP